MAIALVWVGGAFAQKEPDTLIFGDGEKLIGHLVKASGKSVTFKSDIAGEVTVDWSKVTELHTQEAFAVIPATVKVVSRKTAAGSPQGTLTVSNQKIEVKPANGAPSTHPVADSAYVVKEEDFTKFVDNERGFRSDWKGTLTGGLSLIEATQNSRTFTGAVNLSRIEPAVDWLARNNRTTFDFTASYGKVTTPGAPSVKTEIYHADGERDEYFSSAVYGFGQVAFDHNFSQGLDLSQLYGGGIGWTAVKRPKAQLDLKASMSYIRQSFTGAASSQNLIGSTFSDTFLYKLPRGITFNQALSVTPAWNNTNAYSALGSAGLVFPAYKRLSFSLTGADTFLNDPPPGFRKNSFQFTAGLNYALP